MGCARPDGLLPDDRRHRPVRLPLLPRRRPALLRRGRSRSLPARPNRAPGAQFAISQAADTAYKRLMHTIDVPAGGGRLSFWVNRDTEQNWDFFFVEAHTVGADDWTTLPDANGHTSDDTGFVCPFSLELHPFLAHYETRQRRRQLRADRHHRDVERRDRRRATAGSSGRSTSRPSPATGSRSRSAYASDDLFHLRGRRGRRRGRLDRRGDDRRSRTTATRSTAGPSPARPRAARRTPTTGSPARPPTRPSRSARSSTQRSRASRRRSRSSSDLFGPYPFAAAGGIVDDQRGLGFALETQTRPVYALDFFEQRRPAGRERRRPRARAPVVRRLPVGRRAGSTSGSTRASPPTPSGCGASTRARRRRRRSSTTSPRSRRTTRSGASRSAIRARTICSTAPSTSAARRPCTRCG